MKPPQLHPTVRISLIYSLIAGAWIIISDLALGLFVTFPPDLIALQSYKGLFFVVLTAVVLYALVRHEWNIRANTEEELRLLNTELEQRVNTRTAELAQANEQLKVLDELKSKFIADVTHELRNPITSLGIRAHMVKQRLPEEYRDTLFELELQVNQVLGLVESILVLSRVERQKADWRFEPLSLNELIAPLIVTYQPLAENSGLVLTFSPEATLPMIDGVREELSRVASNLIGNAIRYTPSGYVGVRTYAALERKQVVIEVVDSGMGIAPNDVPHLFERFYRSQRSSETDIPGSGLGLSIVHEIIEAHGGSIEVESVMDTGSTFRVWLPLEQ